MGTLDQRTTSSLASEFPVPSLEEWRAAAARELGGADPETLRRIVLGDLPVEPLYARPAAVTRHGRAAAGPWLVEQEIRLGDPQAANRAIRDGLARGQTALRLLIEDDLTLEGLQTALAEVEPAAQPLSIEAGAAGGPALALLAALAEERNVPLEALEGAVGGDPLAELARTGRLAHPLEAAWDALAEATDWAQRRAPSIRTALIDGRPYDEAGASAVEELACVIAAAAETLRAMVARGVEPDRAVDAFAFSLAVSSDAPLEIAKLRAARSLWQLTARAFGGAADGAACFHRAARSNKGGAEEQLGAHGGAGVRRGCGGL
ncbi:MAG: hypothetical protein GC160_20390 [Acidobacteria bacterium]|nr:hypothetical protein [Acidobacteriota bacterium]